VFSLSFLDCISCGFGAVVLLFVIINSQVSVRAEKAAEELQGETSRIEEEVLDGRKNLVRLRNSLRAEREKQEIVAGEARRIEEMLKRLREELASGENDTVARKESIEQLKADIRQLEEANRRLTARVAEQAPETGQRVRTFVGEGNRQYLTGMRMGGSRVLILLDASASMLGRTYVNVVRFRSMPDDRKRQAPKWQQAVKTVDWLTSQIKPGTQVQIYTFNEQARSVMDAANGQWITVKDGTELTAAIASLRKFVPEKGTSLINAFQVIKTLQPQPDNVFLITDGLPTQGEKPPSQTEDVRQERRVKFMIDAVRSVPRRLPVNVLLLPMDGDPDAAGYFWELAYASGGSLLTPSRDWP
jgi:uncharacterized protein YegL